MPMDAFFYSYITAWSVACIVAVTIVLRDPAPFAFFSSTYKRFLLQPWKVITFSVATIGMVVIAPYTGDPTWDYFDAAFMAVFTFLSAPWAVGAIYRAVRRWLPLKQAYVAVCAWMFSASWSYDLYILLRDGAYPITWFPNIFASSILYLSAGLLWNLDWRPSAGVTFAFMAEEWLRVPDGAVFRRVLWYALPFMIIAAAAILYFLV